MRFEKGMKKHPKSGMRKGQVTEVKKTQIELKEMIKNALHAKGGQQWLEDQMDKNPKTFLSLLARVLPTEITGDLTIMVGLADRIAAARQRDYLLPNHPENLIDVTVKEEVKTND